MCILFEKDTGILKNEVFCKMVQMSKNNFTRECITKLNSKEIFDYITFYAQKTKQEFFIYDLNIFETAKKGNLKIQKFFESLEFNLNEIHNLEEGDVVGKNFR